MFFFEKLLSGNGKNDCELMLDIKGNPLTWVRLASTCFEGGQECLVVLLGIGKRKQAEQNAGERVKELQGFYNLAEITEREGITLNTLYQELADILPESWTYPKIACARIVMGDRQFRTKNFMQSALMQYAPINVNGAMTGRIEIGYPGQKPKWTGKLFLEEEQKLLNAIAERLGRITERKLTEEALQMSEERLRDITFSMADWVWEVDENGVYTYSSQKGADLLGSSREDIIGKTPFDFMSPDDVKRVSDIFFELKANKSPIKDLENWNIRRNGERLCMLTNAVPILDKEGSFKGYRGVDKDITERKKVEDALMFLLQSSYSDEDFFQSLARYLANNLDMDYVCIDSLTGDQLSARTLAIYFDGKFEDNLAYTLKDTPCGKVVGKTVCVFPSQVRHLFPNDVVLQEMLAESYAGTTLWSLRGQPIGLIAVIGRKPLSPLSRSVAETILKLVAVRAAGELERRQTEEALSLSEGKYRFLFDMFPLGITVADKHGKILESNHRAERLLGISTEEQKRRAIDGLEWQFIRTDGSTMPPEEYASVRALKENRLIENIKMGIVKGDDGVTWINVTAAPLGDEVVVTYHDITGRTQIEEDLKKSEERYRLLFNSMTEGFALHELILDQNGEPCDYRFLDVNRAFEQLTGLKREEVVGRGQREALPEEDPFWLKTYSKVALSGESIHLEHFSPQLRRHYEVYAYSPARYQFAVVFKDITERKQAEEKLHESESLLLKIAENYPNSYISIIEKDLTVGFSSGQEFTKQNLDPSQFVGLTLEQVFGEYTPLIRDHYLKTFDGVNTEFELLINGQSQFYRTVPLMNQDGRITRIMSVVENITGRKQAEEERERLLAELDQKNKELESFVYIASHDMRSPLVTVQGFGKNIEKYCGQISEALEKTESLDELRLTAAPLLSEKIPNALHFIDSSSLKMHSLVDGLIRLSRVGRMTLQMKYVDVNLMLQHILDTLAFQIEKFNVLVKVQMPMAECYGDKDQLNQVFSNLLDNAIKYRAVERPLVITISGHVEGGKAIYTVADTGRGISPADQEKIWKFFQRVAVDETVPGEGLGLAIVLRIVERHGGRVRVESEIGVGSRFHMELPVKARSDDFSR